jgi:hypothetical protein
MSIGEEKENSLKKNKEPEKYQTHLKSLLNKTPNNISLMLFISPGKTIYSAISMGYADYILIAIG